MRSESGQLAKTFALEMLAKRLWAKVDVRGPDDCWPWLGAKTGSGYGTIRGGISSGGKMLSVHRVAWELVNGPIPDGMCVCHHCDNKPCCNSTHLFLGTDTDNQADRVRKNRSYHPAGEKNAQSRLTAEQVLEIRHRYAEGNTTQRELAGEYGVGSQHISSVICKHRWKHL